jgi:hypothetical protein
MVYINLTFVIDSRAVCNVEISAVVELLLALLPQLGVNCATNVLIEERIANCFRARSSYRICRPQTLRRSS